MSPLAALAAESQCPRDVAVRLCGIPILVPPLGVWPSAAFALLRSGDFDGWADQCLDDDSYVAWERADPTVDDCTAFFEEFRDETGQDLGQASTLAAFLEEHCEAVEADLPRFYPGRSLKELFSGGMSYRELWVLISHLPQDSWTQTALRDDPNREELPAAPGGEERFGPWGLTNLQLAVLTDAVRHLSFVLARVNGNDKYPVPEPTPRPGMKRLARHMVDAAEAEAARRYLDEFNSGKG